MYLYSPGYAVYCVSHCTLHESGNCGPQGSQHGHSSSPCHETMSAEMLLKYKKLFHLISTTIKILYLFINIYCLHKNSKMRTLDSNLLSMKCTYNLPLSGRINSSSSDDCFSVSFFDARIVSCLS